MPDFSVEDKKRQLDFNNIAGVDEAGRGPWAGPVYSAIVILNRNCIPEGINCLLYTSPSPRDRTRSRMPSSA